MLFIILYSIILYSLNSSSNGLNIHFLAKKSVEKIEIFNSDQQTQTDQL